MAETKVGTRADISNKSVDRRHWGARIGIPIEMLRDSRFRREYPFESRIFDNRGHHYHYIDEGEGDPVVMVHGNPTWSYFYRKMITDLRETNRCLAADHLGCGLSSKPEKYDYSFFQHYRNLERWLEAVLPPPDWKNGKITLVVHDWGGPIGMFYAMRHPERIQRLIVMNTSVFTEGVMPLRIRACRPPVLGPLLVQWFNLFVTKAASSTTVKPLSKDVKYGFTFPYNTWNNRRGVLRFVQDIPLKAGTETHNRFVWMETNIVKTLGDIPMLIQWGMKDWCFTPKFLDLWKAKFPNAEIDEYDAGHYLLEDQGEAIIAKIRDFIERPAP